MASLGVITMGCKPVVHIVPASSLPPSPSSSFSSPWMPSLWSSLFSEVAVGGFSFYRHVCHTVYFKDIFQIGISRHKRAPHVFCAGANFDDIGLARPIAPFQPQSPTGLFLTELLHSNPELIPAAVEHELEVLADKREAASSEGHVTLAGADYTLYRRIAELRSQEQFDALEEILYTLIVQKFVEAGVAMVPSVSVLTSEDTLWPLQLSELESMHSLEARQLVLEHSLLVLGKQGSSKYFCSGMFSHMSKMSMKDIYTASVTYGYFLRRLYNRFRLEKAMKFYPHKTGPLDSAEGQFHLEMAAARAVLEDLQGSSEASNSTQVLTSEFLAYIISFDVESLRGFLSIKSKEGRSLVGKHTQALFKGTDIHNLAEGMMRVGGKDERCKMSFLRSKGLVLEAVALGSFLWDVETYVDGFYSLAMS